MPGPIPKRSDRRRRRNIEYAGIQTAPGADQVDVPESEENWHPIAKQWYDSLAQSGQAVFYEPSDWAVAYMIAESISRDLKPQYLGVNEVTGEEIIRPVPMRGANLAAYLKAMHVLMVTEGDRRKNQVELERGSQDNSKENAKVAQMAEYKKAAGVE